MESRRSLLLALLVTVPWTGVLAQEADPLPAPGSRLRVTVACDRTVGAGDRGSARGCRIEGVLRGTSPDSIAVEAAGSTVRYGFEDLRRIEVSRGSRSHRLAGAAVGSVVAAGATAAFLYSGGSTSPCDRSANQDAMSGGECLGLTALGGLAGAGLGALVGGMIRTERWRDVPVERLRPGVGAGPGGRTAPHLVVSF